jgi:hypothetical protein
LDRHPSYYGIKKVGEGMGVNVTDGLNKYIKMMMGATDSS